MNIKISLNLSISVGDYFIRNGRVFRVLEIFEDQEKIKLGFIDFSGKDDATVIPFDYFFVPDFVICTKNGMYNKKDAISISREASSFDFDYLFE